MVLACNNLTDNYSSFTVPKPAVEIPVVCSYPSVETIGPKADRNIGCP
jgi:hypothetical protein